MILAFYSEASGTGKDTSADYAAGRLMHYDYQVTRDAFAWDGKVVAADALGIEGTREEKVALIDEIKLKGEVAGYVSDHDCASVTSGRDFLIGLLGSPDKGTGIRGLDQGFWTRQVIRRAQASEDAWTVISDMRFIEEAEAVKAAGGYVVEIVRDLNLGKFNEQRVPQELVDHTIWNTGTLNDLRTAVSWYVDFVLGIKAGVQMDYIE